MGGQSLGFTTRELTMLESILNAVAHQFGYDIFINFDPEARTDGTSFDVLPAFGGVSTFDGVEVWGFGLHAVISRLQRPRSA